MLSFLFLLLSVFIPSAQAQAWEAAPVVDTSVALQPMPALPVEYVAHPDLYATVYARPLERQQAQALAEHAQAVIPQLASRLGVGAGRSMDIVLAHSQSDFERLQPARTHDWADGTAWPQRSLIYLKAPSARAGTAQPLTRVLEHEVVHVLLGQAFGARPVPIWLQEGLAQYFAGQVSADLPERIGRGVLGGGLLSFEQLSYGFPRDARRADLAYAQSADLIAYIAQEWGEPALGVIVSEMAGGRTMNASLRAATGLTAGELEQRWSARISASGLWITALAGEGVMMLLALPFILLASRSVKRRRQVVLDRWEREDRARDRWLASPLRWSV